MKHTFLNQRKIFHYPCFWRLLLLRCMGFLLLVLCTATSLSAQKVLTGSGSTSCNFSHSLGIHPMGSSFYDNDPITGRIEYVACPTDSNKQVVKVALTMFDVAPGDTLTIYEGCGITNTIVAQTYAGGASASTALPSSWFQANCENSDGCLTFVFAPDGDPANNKGKGVDLEISCSERPAVVECPSDVTIPSACDINYTNSIAAIYTIPKPTTTCTYDALTMPSNLTITTTVTPFTERLRSSEANLVANGDYIDIDGTPGLSPGDKIFLVMGDYNFSYDYMPVSGTTASSTCTFKVTVGEITPVCNNQVNISLNTATCSAQLNADMLIEGDGCWVGYTCNILDGVDAGTDIITYDNVGKKIRVEVATPNGNKCWGYVLVEDKAPPTFTCRDTAIYCGLSLNPDVSNLYPTDGKDCTSFTFEYIDGAIFNYGCNDARRGPDADTIGMHQRIWTAIDAGGARSDTCIQNIYRLRPHLTTGNIVWPGDTIFYCSDDPDRNFPPTISGYPQVDINGQLINLETTCLFGINYDDIDFTTDCEGVVKKGRIWTIIDWCGSGSGLSVIQSDTQLIKMIDTIAPVLIGEPRTLEHFSSHGACSAHVIFPAIQVADACTPSTSYKVQGPLSTIFHTVGSTEPDTMWNVPFGTHDFVYIGEDDCGNQTRHTINMEIKDLINPVAIVSDRSNVSLTNDEDKTWVYATSFDNRSHDNCGVTEILARKMPADGLDSTIPFTEAVGFNCNDLGDTIMVQVRVFDACGNFGENMTEVIIVDKNGVCNCGMVTSLEVSGLNSEGYLCAGDVATLTATGGNRYSWSSLSGGPITSNEITVSPTETTTYTVTITDSNNIDCQVEESLTILVNPAISVTVGIDDSEGGDEGDDNDGDGLLCSGEDLELIAIVDGGTPNYTYIWSNGDTGNFLTENNPTDPSYSVTITDANGCTATDAMDISVTSVPAAIEEISGFSSNGNVCIGGAVTIGAFNTILNDETAYTYEWSTGETTFSISPTIDVSTTYMVTVTDETSGCTASSTLIINTNPLPEASIKVDGVVTTVATVCEGDMLVLEACGGATEMSYAWSTGATNSSTITVESTNTYDVTVTNENDCTAITSIMVESQPVPVASIKVDGAETSSVDICGGDMLVLEACEGDDYSYKWYTDNIDNPLNTDNTLNTITITDGDVYFVEVSIEGNPCTAIDSIVVNRTDIAAPIQADTIICPSILDGEILVPNSIELVPNPVAGLTYTLSGDPNASTLVTPTTTTEYSVMISDGSCEIVETVLIELYDVVTPEIMLNSEDNVIAPGDTRILTWTNSSVSSNITWIPDSRNPTNGNLSCTTGTNCTSTVFTGPNTFGIYRFRASVVDANNCISLSSSRIIEVNVDGNRPAPMATLSGTISTEEGEMVERATISLSDYDMPAQVTGATGDYGFQEVPMNENYTVSPEKDMNPLNGVSTYDLVLISKHILGITPLDSPYKMIAADVNQSGTVTAFDMVQLRQLILNITPDFPNNTSWRFVDAAYEFSDPTNPLREAFPETYAITDLTADMTWLDFIAIKIGDVNNSAVVNNLMTTESRSATKSLNFQARQGLSEDGQYLIFDFTANNFNAISGYQFALQFDPAVIAFDKIVPSALISKDNFGLRDIERGQITTSWNQAEGVDVDEEEVLFSLVFQINGEVTSDELLEIVDTDLQAEAYDATGELLNVYLEGSEIAPQVAAKSIQLFQNRPNPFTGKTTIGFALPEASEATLRIFDAAGKMIQVYDGYYEKGYNELIISSQDLTQYGALYYQLATPTQVATMKMIHAK